MVLLTRIKCMLNHSCLNFKKESVNKIFFYIMHAVYIVLLVLDLYIYVKKRNPAM